MTKQDLLLKALREGRSVTRATALIDLKIPGLSSVISDLRRAGHKIKCVHAEDVTGKAYSRWMLEA